MKYEAGQMWVKDGSFAAVVRTYADGQVRISTDTGSSETYTQMQAANFLHGFTLTNPRGLREAAEAVVNDDWGDREQGMIPSVVALRAALEGGAE